MSQPSSSWSSRSLSLLASLGFVAALVVWRRAGQLMTLCDAANILRTNEISGIDATSTSAFLGRVELGAFVGGALLATAALARAAPRSRLAEWIVGRPALWGVALAVLSTAAILRARGTVHLGQLVFHLEDDAMISMRYAHNLASGSGLVYNPGEHVEGYTDFLWVLVMAAVHLVTPDRLTSAVMLLLNGALLVGIVLLLQGILLHARAGVPAVLVLVVCAATAVDANLLMWLSSGLEAVAMAFLVTLCAWCLLQDDRRLLFALSLALIPLVRSDGALLAALLGGCFLVKHGWRSTGLLALAALPTVAHLGFRLSYYGYPFPNTYYLKMIRPVDRILIGIGGYGFRFAIGYTLVALLAGYVALSRAVDRTLRLLAGVMFVQVAYSVYVGGDTFWDLRFVTPVLPLGYALAAVGLSRLLADLDPARMATVALFTVSTLAFQTFDGRLGTVIPTHRFLLDVLATADTLEANLPAGSSVSIYSAGTVPYFAPHLRFIDVLGKTEAHIGHQPGYRGRIIGHNKYDFDWIYGVRRPDVAFTAMDCPDVGDFENLPEDAKVKRMNDAKPDDFLAPLYEVSTLAFRRDYFATWIPLAFHVSQTEDSVVRKEAESFSGCLFARADSRVSRQWTPKE